MSDMAHRLTDVATVEADGSWVCTVRTAHGEDEEVVLVPCAADDTEPVRAWINRCTHERQRLHREGVGVVEREGQIICPRHGSMFDACSGDCDNGEAAQTTLVSVAIEVREDQVYLVDEAVTYLYDGPIRDDGDDDDMPGSTSHIQL